MDLPHVIQDLGKYEDLLNQATSRDELEQVALRWEYSLMLRMLDEPRD